MADNKTTNPHEYDDVGNFVHQDSIQDNSRSSPSSLKRAVDDTEKESRSRKKKTTAATVTDPAVVAAAATVTQVIQQAASDVANSVSRPGSSPLPAGMVAPSLNGIDTTQQMFSSDLAGSSLAHNLNAPMDMALSTLHNNNVLATLSSNAGPNNNTGDVLGEDPNSSITSGKRSNANRSSTLPEDRRQRRLSRNRLAAKECRKKKKDYIAGIEEENQKLKEENSRLHKEVDELNAKLTLGAMQNSESYRLMKEVEELNAKLSLSQIPGAVGVQVGVGEQGKAEVQMVGSVTEVK